MSRGLTRQDMKRDEVREQFESFFHYLEAHWKPVVLGIGKVEIVRLGSPRRDPVREPARRTDRVHRRAEQLVRDPAGKRNNGTGQPGAHP